MDLVWSAFFAIGLLFASKVNSFQARAEPRGSGNFLGLLGDCTDGVAMRRDKEVPAAELVVEGLHAALDSFAAVPLTPLAQLTNPGGYQRVTLCCDEQVEMAAARPSAASGTPGSATPAAPPSTRSAPALRKKNASCPKAPDVLACQLAAFTSALNVITTLCPRMRTE
jgi:hypothetical protein